MFAATCMLAGVRSHICPGPWKDPTNGAKTGISLLCEFRSKKSGHICICVPERSTFMIIVAEKLSHPGQPYNNSTRRNVGKCPPKPNNAQNRGDLADSNNSIVSTIPRVTRMTKRNSSHIVEAGGPPQTVSDFHGDKGHLQKQALPSMQCIIGSMRRVSVGLSLCVFVREWLHMCS